MILFYFQVNKYLHTMKLTEEKLSIVFTQNVTELANMFSSRNHEIRVVGGAVRDLLMDINSTDSDFATTATPDQMKAMFNEENVRILNRKGEMHGTVAVKFNDEDFEFTTLRIDEETDGRHARVKFVTDWTLDAARRDFSINALYLSKDGTIFDYFDGIEHLKQRKLIFIGDKDIRLQEDYLRILRYFRFFGRISSDEDRHDPEMLNSISKHASGLAKLSGQRIWKELSKIIKLKTAPKLFTTMVECGIAPHVSLPTNFDCDNLVKLFDNLENCDIQIENVHHMTLIASGFKNVEDCCIFIDRIKCSKFEKELLLFIVNKRDEFSTITEFKILQDTLIDMIFIDRQNRATSLSLFAELLKYSCNKDLIREFDSWEVPIYPIRGQVLREIVKSNKNINSINHELIELWKKSNYSLNDKELLVSLKNNKLCHADKIDKVVNEL